MDRMKKSNETVARNATDRLVHTWAQYGIPMGVIHAIQSEQPTDALQILRQRQKELIATTEAAQLKWDELRSLKEILQKTDEADVPDTLTHHIKSMIVSCQELMGDAAASQQLADLESQEAITAENLIGWCDKITRRDNRLLHRMLVQTIRGKLPASRGNLYKLLKAKSVRTLLTDQDHKDVLANHDVDTLYALGIDPEMMAMIDDADIGEETYILVINKFLKTNRALPHVMKERMRKRKPISANMRYHYLLAGLHENDRSWVSEMWCSIKRTSHQWCKADASRFIHTLKISRYDGKTRMLRELCHMCDGNTIPWTRLFMAIAKIRAKHQDEETNLRHTLRVAMEKFPLTEKGNTDRWASALEAAIQVEDEPSLRLLLNNMNAELAHKILIDRWSLFVTTKNDALNKILQNARKMVLREREEGEKAANQPSPPAAPHGSFGL